MHLQACCFSNLNLLLFCRSRCRCRRRCLSSLMTIRDLTIRQRRRPWKRLWKIDSASFFKNVFRTFSRLSQFALLLKRREFWLELKRGDRARVQTEMVEFNAACRSRSQLNLNFGHFTLSVVQGQQRSVQKKRQWCTCRVVVFPLNLLGFFDVLLPVDVVVS